jgi:tight adherence protein C
VDATSLAIAGMVAFAVLFGVLGLASGGPAGNALARKRLDDLTRGQPQIDLATPRHESFGRRVLGPLRQSATNTLSGLLPRGILAGVQKSLLIAGEPMTMQGFLTMLMVSTGASVGLAVLLLLAGVGQGLIGMGMLALLALIGFYLPFYLVKSRARQRQTAITKSLPDAFDLITTCVEAGLGLDAALSRVAEKVHGPFADELSRALRDVSLGKSRRESLKELGERTGVPDLIQFTNAVIQAEAMGSSVGTVLRVQADQLRIKRRQRAEQTAYKAPVKMLFPLVLCIFPTLFIVILGPAIITIMNGFPK